MRFARPWRRTHRGVLTTGTTVSCGVGAPLWTYQERTRNALTLVGRQLIRGRVTMGGVVTYPTTAPRRLLLMTRRLDAGDVGGEEVNSVAVEVPSCAVVVLSGSGVGVSREDLGVA